MKNLFWALGATSLLSLSSYAEIREYTLNTSFDESSGRIVINNQTIAPTLYANEGDTLRIIVNNQMDEASSIHWHGVLLPNDQDGVPNITTQEIAAGSQFIYEYKVEQTGTYWYHSHTGLQEQQGLYGAIVFNDKLEQEYGYTEDKVIMLSDYSAASIEEITTSLEKTGMYKAPKPMAEASHGNNGHDGHNMPAQKSEHSGHDAHAGHDMQPHMSDIFYDHILINNIKDNYDISLENAGEWMRLRLVNAGSSSYFKLSYDAPFYVIAADGLTVKPVAVNSLQIVNGETYDILVQAPKEAKKIIIEAIDQNIQAELHISAQNNNAEQPEDKDFVAQAKIITHLDDITLLEPLAGASVEAAKDFVEIDFALTGSMMPYSWSINDKIFGEAEHIKINKDDVMRIRFINKTDMPHPMHLHGFFFNIVKEDGSLSIPKHTINVNPEETVTIEFKAGSALGKWMIHCHNLYHMKYGMMQMIEVQ